MVQFYSEFLTAKVFFVGISPLFLLYFVHKSVSCALIQSRTHLVVGEFLKKFQSDNTNCFT